MDEAFMHGVKERIAAATPAVAASATPTSADPDRPSVLQPLGEWMASYLPDAKCRCAECKCPGVEGAKWICFGCGSPLLASAAAKQDPFIFDKSLTKKHFCDSVHLEYRDYIYRAPSSTIKPAVQETLPDISQRTDADNMLHQSYPAKESRVGAIVDEKSSQSDGGSENTYSNATSSDSVDVSFENEMHEKEDELKSSTLHDEESVPGIEASRSIDSTSNLEHVEIVSSILSPDRLGSSASRNNLNRPSSRADASAPHIPDMELIPWTEDVPIATVGPHVRVDKDESSWQHLEKDFDAFFQGNPSSSSGTANADMDTDVRSPSLLLDDFGSSNAETNFDAFVTVAHDVGDPFKESMVFGEQSSFQNSVNSDGFLQAALDSFDQPHRQNLRPDDTTAVDGFDDVGLDIFFQTPQRAGSVASDSKTRDNHLEVNLDEFFQAVATTPTRDAGTPDSLSNHSATPKAYVNGTDSFPFEIVKPELANGSAVHDARSRNSNANAGEGFSGQDDLSFEDFFAKVPHSELQRVKSDISLAGAEHSGQDLKTEFDQGFLTSSTTSKQAVENGLESIGPTTGEATRTQAGISKDSNGFFTTGSETVAGQPTGVKVLSANNATGEADGDRVEKAELRAEKSDSGAVHGETFDFSFAPLSDGTTAEVNFDDFLQATPKSKNGNGNVTPSLNANELTDEFDFEDFRQADDKPFHHADTHSGEAAVVKPASGFHEQKFDTNFDNVFQVSFRLPNSTRDETRKAGATLNFFPTASEVTSETHKDNGNLQFYDFLSTAEKSSQPSVDMEQTFADFTMFEQSSPRIAKEGFVDSLMLKTTNSVDATSINRSQAAQVDLPNGSHEAENQLSPTSSIDFDDFVQAPNLPEASTRTAQTAAFDDLVLGGNRPVDKSSSAQEISSNGLQGATNSLGSLPGKGGAEEFDFFNFSGHTAISSNSLDQNITTEFDMFGVPQVKNSSSHEDFDSFFEVPTRPASKLQDPSGTLDFDFFQLSTPSKEVSKLSGAATDDNQTAGGGGGNTRQDGWFPPSTEAKDGTANGASHIRKNGSTDGAFGLPDKRSTSKKVSLVEPAATAARSGASDLSALFSDFLVFDDNPQRRR